MQTLLEIQAKIAELQAQEKLIRAQEYSQALQKVQELITSHNIAAADLKFNGEVSITGKKEKGPKALRKAVIKYRDQNGNEWSGRGLKPKWLTAALAEGKTVQDFAIAQETA